MEAFIQKLRRRALLQKVLAFLALAGAVIIVMIGTDYFIHESPKIAAQDIEQQRKLISSQDVISRLASLSISIFNNAEQLSNAENELINTQIVLRYDGNSGLDDIKSTLYFDLAKSGNPVSQDAYQHNFYSLGRKNLNEIDSLLNDIRRATSYLESENAIDKFLTDLQTMQNSNKKRLEELVHGTDKLKADLVLTRSRISQIGEAIPTPTELKRLISYSVQAIQDLERTIKEFDEKMSTNQFPREAEEQIKMMLQTNKEVIEQIEAFKIKVISNRDLYQEKLQKQQELVNKLRTEKANLEAEKEFTVSLKSGIEPVMGDSKLAFYVSTNIARLGIMIVTLFLAQVFISIYRYLTKISNFYHARADALEILTQTESLKNTDLPGSIEMFSNIFSPEKVDFGKMPQAPVNDAIKSVQSIFPKS